MKRRSFFIVAAFPAAVLVTPGAPAADAEKQTGTLTGEITEKGETWIRVKPSEGESERFVPRWIGGNPRDGGGFDQAMLAKFRDLKPKDKVKVEWVFEERKRALKIEKIQ